MTFIKDIYKSLNPNQTVFSLADLSSINPLYNGPKLNSAIKYLVKNKDLIRVSKGLYSLNNDYSRQELANKYRVPSYISLYTVLAESGVVFQPYSSIYLLSQRSEIKNIKEVSVIYRKIKDSILLNRLGIVNTNGVFKATPERAVCDKIYLDGDEYFDNVRSIDWELIKKINSEVYNNNQVISKWILQNTKPI